MKKTGRLDKRFGAKFGFTLRRAWNTIAQKKAAKYKCPKCERIAVRRVAVGIWECRKCGLKFAGGAYEPFTRVGLTSLRSSGIAEE